jgi:hypothetical protein
LTAENVELLPGIQTGKDYLFHASKALKRSGFETLGEAAELPLGGLVFYRQDFRAETNDHAVYTTGVATVFHRYAILFKFIAGSQAELDDLVNTMHSLKVEEQSHPTSAVSSPENPVEAGSLGADVYRSDYFKFRYPLPAGWFADTEVYKKRLAEKLGGNSNPQKGTSILLHADEHAPGTPGVTAMAQITVVAGDSGASRYVITGKEYLPLVTRSITAKGDVKLLQQGREYDFGGHRFFRADYKRNDLIGGYQAILCTVWKRHILGWTLLAPSESQVDNLVQSLKKISVD